MLNRRHRSHRANRPRLVARRVVYQGRGVGSVYEADVLVPDGSVHTYSYLVKRPFVVVVAISQDRVVLVSQHRYPQRRETWELVKGGVDAGESPRHAAQRELKEETGFRARQWLRLGTFVIAPGYFNQVGHVFLARGLLAGRAQAELGGERLRVKQVTWPAVRRLAANGKLYDSTSMAGLWLAERHVAVKEVGGKEQGGGGRKRAI